MLYKLLKLIVTIGVRLYYKELKVLNKENLPSEGPCIYIANHPNTLMDAWLLGFVSKTPVFFMAKATLFSSPLKNKLLRSFNMIPINRKGEGKIEGVSNQDSFAACYKILEEGKTLLIFPEGTSYLERTLRELKSGTARIALEAEKRNNGKLGVKIIPIGLNYLNANAFRSNVLVNVGKPISIESYVESYQQNTTQTAKKLTEVFRIRLEQLLVNSKEKEEEILVSELYSLFASKYISKKHNGVKGELAFLKEIRDKIEEIKLTAPWKIDEIKNRTSSIKHELNKLEIRPDFLDRRFRTKMFFRQLVFSFVFVLIGLPLYIFGLIHCLFQYKLTDLIIPKITKDIEYYAPLSVLIGLILYPLVFSLFVVGLTQFYPLTFGIKLLYFISMPITGLIAYSIHAYLKHILCKWRFLLLLLKDKSKIDAIKAEKEVLREMVF